MRNLLEYPITTDEIVFYLDRMAEIATRNEEELTYGDMGPLLLAKAKEIVLASGFAQCTRDAIIEECAKACEARIKGTDGLPGGDDYGHYAPYNCEDLACAKAVRALSAVTSTES